MATSYADAVRNGVMAARRLHMELGYEEDIRASGGNVDVFAAFLDLGVPLLFRRLEGLLGAYLKDATGGALVTTERSLNIQRFTAAHELGHHYLDHSPSVDDESILRRMADTSMQSGFEEIEADAFASAFLLPRWLITFHLKQQGWKAFDFNDPVKMYQLSLRMGSSYAALCWTMQRYSMIDPVQGDRLRSVKLRDIKAYLLGDVVPESYRGDVWLISDRDKGLRIEGSNNDHLVIRIKEDGGGGYAWETQHLAELGFELLDDKSECKDEDSVGSAYSRVMIVKPQPKFSWQFLIEEKRRWEDYDPKNTLYFTANLSGPEQEGFSRAERRHLLEVA